jgi:hypothetical protein
MSRPSFFQEGPITTTSYPLILRDSTTIILPLRTLRGAKTRVRSCQFHSLLIFWTPSTRGRPLMLSRKTSKMRGMRVLLLLHHSIPLKKEKSRLTMSGVRCADSSSMVSRARSTSSRRRHHLSSRGPSST